MGKRKQARPRRNLSAAAPAASERDQITIPAKRQRPTIEESSEETCWSENAAETKDASGTHYAQSVVSDGESNDPKESPCTRPSLAEAVRILSMSAESEPFRSDQLLSADKLASLSVVLEQLLEWGEDSGSFVTCLSLGDRVRAIRSAVAEFGVLELHFTTPKRTSTIENSIEPNGLPTVLMRTALDVPKQSTDGATGTVMVELRLAPKAFQSVAPEAVGMRLLGCGPSALARKKGPSVQAAIALRASLAAFSSVIAGIHNDPTGVASPPVAARSIYALVDNQRFLDRCARAESADRVNAAPATNIGGLRPTLRVYQSYAVEWMLSREKEDAAEHSHQSWEACWLAWDPHERAWELPPAPSVGGSGPWYNPFTGWLCSGRNEARQVTTDGKSGVRGGILAESMGLGKTIEVLACVLSHRRPKREWTPAISFRSILEHERRRQSMSGHSKQHGDLISAPLSPSNSSSDCSPNGNEEDSNEEIESTPVLPKTIVVVRRDKRPGRNVEGGNARVVRVTEQDVNTTGEGRFRYDAKYLVGGRTERKLLRSQFDLLQPDDAPTFSSEHRGDISVCIVCGRSSCSASLGWVTCRGCRENLHAACAGYDTQGELPLEGVCSAARCPSCSARVHAKTPVRSRATLIVTPPAILDQWFREIRKHASGSLKVLVYPGLKRLCDPTRSVAAEDRRLVHAHELADADVVLTTFPVLNGELAHSDNRFLESGEGSVSFRAKKRYRVVPSPLDGIEWWRVCLDEAQKVEGTAAAAARMARRLRGVQRWCVTGTPIGKGKLEDLYGLLLFLGIEPFQDKHSFRHCLHGSHPGFEGRIQRMLYPIFWRSTKANSIIQKQLGIPEQIEKKVFLEFSSIERHFYQKQLENTILAVNDTTATANKRKTEAVSFRLHCLRAACCHPQVGSSGIQKLGPKKTGPAADRVLSMEQILDKLIDDARLKCEESQRIAILHTNALACISNLKVELKEWKNSPFSIEQSEEELLKQSANLYLEALELTDANAKPSEIIGEAELSGCAAYLNPGTIIRDGVAFLGWKLRDNLEERKVCEAKVEFHTGKKLTGFKVRPLFSAPPATSFDKVLLPKDCVLQVSLTSLGGAFVNVRKFSLNESQEGWLSFDGIRTARSKIWRVLVESYHHNPKQSGTTEEESSLTFVGMEIHFMEPTVGADNLQRMHILHNSALVLDSLLQAKVLSTDSVTKGSAEDVSGNCFLENFEAKLSKVKSELQILESNYLGAAKNYHRASRMDLSRLSKRQLEHEKDLRRLANLSRKMEEEGWQDVWWEDLFSYLQLENTVRIPVQSKENLCSMVKNDLYELFNGPFDVGDSGFPEFESIFGLQIALNSRKDRYNQDRSPIYTVSELKDEPSEWEILENSSCHKCRADWFQTGPKCSHCKLEERLIGYQEYFNDRVILSITRSISRWLNDMCSRQERCHDEASVFLHKSREKAHAYFKLRESEMKEIVAAKRHWRMHFDLLSDYDELNSCKSTMRLPRENENLHDLPKHEVDRIIDPRNIPALIMEHRSKQATSLAALRRDTASLRFLKNQSLEQVQIKDRTVPSCPVCLLEFSVADRAVLKCGHSLHLKCIDEILKRSGGSSNVRCPMKCAISTSKCDIMIAASKVLRKDDGSSINRKIEGSWGTKVDRLIVDLMEVIDRGERCLVFSQWDDLLLIVEESLFANNIAFTHPKGTKMFGKSVQALRTSCQVMLLNVKRGAEGLTLVEATHVFIIEPLLHCGLDAQAINRVHRIGQTAKTYIHRYIIRDTIEEKIDAIRMERQAIFENVEEEESILSSRSKKGNIQAGGMDGGFTAEELKEVFNSL